MTCDMGTERKKICLLIYNLGSGGAEHVLSQWSILLSEKYDVYMTVFDGDTVSNYEYYGKLYNLDVKSDNSSIIHKVLIVLKRAYRLRKFVRRNSIDLVLSFCNECNLANTISVHKAKKVCSIRSVSDLDANMFVKYVVKTKNNLLVLQTETLREMLMVQYGKRIRKKTVVFGNPFNADFIIRKSKEAVPKFLDNILAEKKTIVNVASIKPSKNHENLLRSFELVCDKNPETYLLLIGADPLGKEDGIKRMAEKSKHSDHIIFVGELKNPFPVVSKASIFVLPSLAEGIPNALVEAMICGIPIISSNCLTGPKELLTDFGDTVNYNEKGYAVCKYGILVKPFSGSALPNYDYTYENYCFANAITDVLDSKALYNDLKQKAVNGAKRFDIKKYKKDLNAFVDTLWEN